MVLLFTSGLIVSIVGLVSLLALKYWELSTGRLVAISARPRVSRASRSMLFFFEQVVPALVRVYSRRAWRALLGTAHFVSAWVVLKVEYVLEHTLQKLRRSTEVRRGTGEASAFLRQVAEHKKKLLSEKENGESSYIE